MDERVRSRRSPPSCSPRPPRPGACGRSIVHADRSSCTRRFPADRARRTLRAGRRQGVGPARGDAAQPGDRQVDNLSGRLLLTDMNKRRYWQRILVVNAIGALIAFLACSAVPSWRPWSARWRGVVSCMVYGTGIGKPWRRPADGHSRDAVGTWCGRWVIRLAVILVTIVAGLRSRESSDRDRPQQTERVLEVFLRLTLDFLPRRHGGDLRRQRVRRAARRASGRRSRSARTARRGARAQAGHRPLLRSQADCPPPRTAATTPSRISTMVELEEADPRRFCDPSRDAIVNVAFVQEIYVDGIGALDQQAPEPSRGAASSSG